MISLEVIEREIDELEHREASYKVCERLSWLYVVRDHLMPPADGVVSGMGGSEFLDAANGVGYRALLQVVDEYLQALSLVQPKSYASLIQKIREMRG